MVKYWFWMGKACLAVVTHREPKIVMNLFSVTFVFMGLKIGVILVAADCSDPPDIPGAEHTISGSAPFPENTTITYNCMYGYRERGTTRTYICTDSHWLGDYMCQPISCGYIAPPDNGRVVTEDPSYTAGTRIIFACNEGYTMSGSSSLLCRTDGRWTPSKPRCNVVMCEDFGTIANADLSQEAPDGIRNDYGSTIHVTCRSNHVLVGNSVVTCGANGQWGPRPTCDRVTCSPYPGSNSSCVDHTALTMDNLYFMVCKGNSENVSITEIGDGYVECINGQWTDLNMACYCDCKINTDPTRVTLHNVVTHSFLKHGQTLFWQCQVGNKNTLNPIQCNDGTLTATPSCLVPTTTSTTTILSTTKNPTTQGFPTTGSNRSTPEKRARNWSGGNRPDVTEVHPMGGSNKLSMAKNWLVLTIMLLLTT